MLIIYRFFYSGKSLITQNQTTFIDYKLKRGKQKFVSIFSIKVSKEFIKKQKGLQQSYKILYVMTMLHDTRNHPLTLQRVVFENICNSPFVWSKISSKIAWGFKNNFKSHIFLFN